ncbi:MAG: hypothetical protein PWP64_463 [Candidatus Cloacimonadota bacterium]|jgi:hypothetical protein|nr:hypothetical protein [Candidatus Cloacimonadota bacterium]
MCQDYPGWEFRQYKYEFYSLLLVCEILKQVFVDYYLALTIMPLKI